MMGLSCAFLNYCPLAFPCLCPSPHILRWCNLIKAGATYRPVGYQPTGQMFRMIVYLIFRHSICECCDICIVAVGQDSGLLVFESSREQVGGPKDIGFGGGPSIQRVAVQAMNEDHVDKRVGCRVDFCKAILLDWFSSRGTHPSSFLSAT